MTKNIIKDKISLKVVKKCSTLEKCGKLIYTHFVALWKDNNKLRAERWYFVSGMINF